MIIILFEGVLDFLFFKSFFTKFLKFKNVGNEGNKEWFDKLLDYGYFEDLKNFDTSKIAVLREKGDKFEVMLISVGGKDSFKDAIRAFIEGHRILEKKIFGKIEKIIVVVDDDAKDKIGEIEKLVENKNLKDKFESLVLNGELEDVVLLIYEVIKDRLNDNDKKAIKEFFDIISKRYDEDKEKHNKKRKVSALHTAIGYRCYGHLFDELFEKFELDDLDNIEEFKKFYRIFKY
ncbi:hypothetical protein [Methanotorris igneus]|uniref:Uncharacterized protein n=1 Tax=Methanotorris igneus (strain DSM 5666 / JCM 11834 / Kol 5) TaxID=880724 RepID=F6BE77_METIK|nr:hypothetical protein [Methanotorris igneus]AEF96754.1 hypothetical protein Metig_1216 [Methanotorris igneus Kol 5]